MLKCYKIHFIGIGGIGVSAIAKLMLKGKKKVSGSDLDKSEITEELKKIGAKIFKGHKTENLSKNTDLVIYSPAVLENNPERAKAKKLGIPQFSYPEILGKISKEKFTIAVSGTNGKSTTTALLGLILEKANFDPTVIVGSKVQEWNGNLKLGGSKYFVVEACEWRAHMLNLNPKIIVLTNLESDHLDYYRDIQHLIQTFQIYIDKLAANNILILNADDKNLAKLKPKCKVITYGIKNKADVMAKNIIIKSGRQKFDLIWRNKTYKLELKIPGLFNIYNVLSAAAAALFLGANPEIIQKTVADFNGIWRRFEVKSLKIKNCLDSVPISSRMLDSVGIEDSRLCRSKLKIISDYAHHPTAIQGTIQAAREFYPGQRIVAVFQPHHRSRTRKLFKEFVESFGGADLAIISEIYDVAGRENKEDKNISSRDLVKEMKKQGQSVYYAPNLIQTKKMVLKYIKPNDIVLIMGAGDIYKIADQLK